LAGNAPLRAGTQNSTPGSHSSLPRGRRRATTYGDDPAVLRRDGPDRARDDRSVAQALASRRSPGARNRSSGAALADARSWAKGAARDSAVGADRRHLGTGIDAPRGLLLRSGASTEAASTRCAFVARSGALPTRAERPPGARKRNRGSSPRRRLACTRVLGKPGPSGRSDAAADGRRRAEPRCWRKPGKLRPSYYLGVFPDMSAKQRTCRRRRHTCRRTKGGEPLASQPPSG
jgi:hypothetical protein